MQTKLPPGRKRKGDYAEKEGPGMIRKRPRQDGLQVVRKKWQSSDTIPKSVPTDNYEAKPVTDVGLFMNRLITEKAPAAWRDFLHADTKQDEVVAEFFSSGGQVLTLTRGFDESENEVKVRDISALFSMCQGFLMCIAKSEDPTSSFAGRGFAFGLELCRTLLDDHNKDMMALLAHELPPPQAKSVLKLLTSMVTLGPAASKMVVTKLDWDDFVWRGMADRRSVPANGKAVIVPGDETDIRTCYIHFLLSFLVEPTQFVLKEYFESNTRLTSIYPGLVTDSPELVLLVLETLRTYVVESSTVAKTYKMKLLGSSSLNKLLELVNWKGPKLLTQPEPEAREEIISSLYSMLNIVLTSQKNGVIFQDADYACEKSCNPLLSQLIQKINQPWETPALSKLVANILVANPGELPAYLDKHKRDGVLAPRESGVWHKLVDMYYYIFTELSVEKILTVHKKKVKVAHHILKNIIFSEIILDELIIPGLKVPDQNVVRKCMELFELMAKKAEEYSVGSTCFSVPDELKTMCTARLPELDSLMKIWQTAVLTKDQTTLNCILSFVELRIKYFGLEKESAVVKMLSDLKDLDFTADKTAAEKSGLTDPMIHLLFILTSILNTDNHSTQFFAASFLSEETLSILLTYLTNESSGETAQVARKALTSIAKISQVCLADGIDLDIMLDLIMTDASLVADVSKILWNSIYNVKSLEQEIIGYTNDNDISNDALEELFAALMKNDPLPENLSPSPGSNSNFISPLILSLLDIWQDVKSKDYLTKFLDCLLVTVSNKDDVMKIAKPRCEKLSAKNLNANLSWLTCEEALKQTGLRKVYASKLAKLQDNQALTSFLEQIDDEVDQKCVVEHLFQKDVLGKFSLFSTDKTDIVLVVLPYVHKFSIDCEDFSGEVIAVAEAAIDNKEIKKFSLARVLDIFEWADFKEEDLIKILNKLSEQGVNKLLTESCGLNQRGALTVACIKGLGNPKLTIQNHGDIFSKLSSHLEFILEKTSDDHLMLEMTRLLQLQPNLADQLAVNVMYVLTQKLANDSSKNLVVQLVKSSDKMAGACLDWLGKVKNKTVSDSDVLVLANLLITHGCMDKIISHKKAVKSLIKKSTSCITSAMSKLSDAGGEDTTEAKATDSAKKIIKRISSDVSSSKAISIVQTFFSENKEQLRKVVTDSSLTFIKRKTCIEFVYHVLTILGDKETNIKKHLLNYVLIPIIQTLPLAWSQKDPADKADIIDLCRIGLQTGQTQTYSAVRNYLKKNKDVWSGIIKCILKNGLKDEEFGAVGIALLSTLCSLRYRDSVSEEQENWDAEDSEEMNLVVDMIVSHSAYLKILFGDRGLLKEKMADLLVSLAPASCRPDQVEPLLAGYTGTLHPSDTALLRLFCTMESHGVNINFKRPFMFGPQAIRQMSTDKANVNNKFSDCIAAIKPDIAKKTFTSFPISLPLHPLDDYIVEESAYNLYDPRFLMPYLSSLTSQDVYIDRHMRLVESQSFGLAMASLSSENSEMRSMGYHTLHRLYIKMSESKLGVEKQIWMHMIDLVRHGLSYASEEKVGYKIPSITTLFMAQSCVVVQNPAHFLYNKVSSFLMVKPFLNLFHVPEFSKLFHSADVNPKQQQTWILTIIRDGMRSQLDHQILMNGHVYKLILSNATSSLANKNILVLVLEILEAATRLPAAVYDLTVKLALLQWLNLVLVRLDEERDFELLVNIYTNVKKGLYNEAKDPEKMLRDSSVLECNVHLLKSRLSKVDMGQSHLIQDQLKMLC